MKRSVFLAALALLSTQVNVKAQDASAQGGGYYWPVVKGATSSQTPYLHPTIYGVITKSLLTVGDSVNKKANGAPYRMVGIADGMGAYDNGDNTFTLLMNHEIRGGLGVVRAHGADGAFVSKWTISKKDLRVLKGEDLVQNVVTYNAATGKFNAPAKGVTFQRLCSADLPPVTAFYNKKTKNGYNGMLFMNGEETGAEGRAFAHALDGTSYELPHLGKSSWENILVHPNSGDKTIVIGTDDSTPGQLYVYVGTKQKSGSPVERAGLVGGKLYGVKVNGVALESRESGIANGTRFSLHEFGNVANWTGAQLQSESVARGVTDFLRPEDAQWDANNPRDFYFVTTDRFDTTRNPGTSGGQVGRSRLYRLHFDDLNNPAMGGVIDTLLNGTEHQQMMDNMTIDNKSRVAMIQEDPGNQPYLAKIHMYNGVTKNLTSAQRLVTVAQHDPMRFLPGAPNFLTQDEESSGIIDISKIVKLDGLYLAVVQAHYPIEGELVEGGQLVALYVPPLNENGAPGQPKPKKPLGRN